MGVGRIFSWGVNNGEMSFYQLETTRKRFHSLMGKIPNFKIQGGKTLLPPPLPTLMNKLQSSVGALRNSSKCEACFLRSGIDVQFCPSVGRMASVLTA